ncbi:serine/threonine protein kinase [Streptomyces sp. TRM66268-LWL]|uniref:non-specific serine/threonine protein kinase n=1 Tax=Streptomyces polyasparticus TaxID=2767826 RepID=A0ABR7SP75_9ACTN|nr:serine/threonine protein kinase [Streptomyces polyasparticus]
MLVGRYRIEGSLGHGGMGKVWRAHDEVLHRVVAVKELTAARYAGESERAVLLARTQKEARAAARINHSAVVTVHDVFEHDDRPWIVMELVDGRSLADAVRDDRRVPPREAARIGMWVLRALRAAHTAGVLHRDVKPANVLLARDGRVLITDFGIAAIEGDSTITRTGELVGSIDYLAPERVRGEAPGPASDLWALGATLYAAVEGESPFRRTSPLSTMQAVVEEEPRDSAYAGPLGPVITALLRKDPAQRPSVDEAEQMLAEVSEGRAPQSAQAYVPTRRVAPDELTAVRPGDTTAAPAAAPVRRRRLRSVVGLVVAAALVGAAAAFGVLKYMEQREPDGTGTGQTAGSAPKDWKRVRDEAGFSVLLPAGWKRQTEGAQIDYTPDDGVHLLRIAIDKEPDFENAYLHVRDMEKQGMGRISTYRQIKLRSNFFRDRPGAVWEFRWTQTTGVTKGERRAIDQLYVGEDGTEYAIYMSGPVKDWDKTREKFDHILRSWQPPRS